MAAECVIDEDIQMGYASVAGAPRKHARPVVSLEHVVQIAVGGVIAGMTQIADMIQIAVGAVIAGVTQIADVIQIAVGALIGGTTRSPF